MQLVALAAENEPAGHTSHEAASAAKKPAGQTSHVAWRPRSQPDSVMQEGTVAFNNGKFAAKKDGNRELTTGILEQEHPVVPPASPTAEPTYSPTADPALVCAGDTDRRVSKR